MGAAFPTTPLSLLSQLRAADDQAFWQVSWKRFLELYHEPLEVIARSCYRHHTNGHVPSQPVIEDIIATVVADFFTRGLRRYDAEKGRLRSYLRLITNARVVDVLRKERPLDHFPANGDGDTDLPDESREEADAFHRSLLATMVEDLRHQIPLRQFECFERVKLKHQRADMVAGELGMSRAMVDRYIHKAMSKLRDIARDAEYQEEFYP